MYGKVSGQYYKRSTSPSFKSPPDILTLFAKAMMQRTQTQGNVDLYSGFVNVSGLNLQLTAMLTSHFEQILITPLSLNMAVTPICRKTIIENSKPFKKQITYRREVAFK